MAYKDVTYENKPYPLSATLGGIEWREQALLHLRCDSAPLSHTVKVRFSPSMPIVTRPS